MCKLLTPQQICERYHISKWTLYQWTSKGSIPYLKIRRLVRFDEQEIEKWEKTGSVKVNLI